jgi:hypothetical protein
MGVRANSAENRGTAADADKKANFFVWLAQRSNIGVVISNRRMPRRGPQGEAGAARAQTGDRVRNIYVPDRGRLIKFVAQLLSRETEAALRER